MEACCIASSLCSFLAGCADLLSYLIYLMYHAFDCIYSIAVPQNANKHIICSLITPVPLIINHCQYQWNSCDSCYKIKVRKLAFSEMNSSSSVCTPSLNILIQKLVLRKMIFSISLKIKIEWEKSLMG